MSLRRARVAFTAGVALLFWTPVAAFEPERGPASFGMSPGPVQCELPGVSVGSVAPGRTAAALGLQSGDRILSINGQSIRSDAEMLAFAQAMRAGDDLTVLVRRGERDLTLSGRAVGGAAPAGLMIKRPGAELTAANALTMQQARHTASEFAHAVMENYVDPAMGVRYASAIRARISAGAYDKAGTAGALADMVTKDVQQVAREGHLRLLAERPVEEHGAVPLNPSSVVGQPTLIDNVATQHLQGSGWIAPGVAYVRFDRFSDDPVLTAATTHFMAQHADAQTIIFDLRANAGGALDQTKAIMPYLFARETVLSRSDTRASVVESIGGLPPEPSERVVSGGGGVITREYFVTPHPHERRLFDARVLVLTSSRTASAAEHFAMALKSTGRGTVIGETTAGAGNYAIHGYTPVGELFRAFIPNGKGYDARTGRGWEGVGIDPDVRVASEAALREALMRAGTAAAEAKRLAANTDERAQRPLGPRKC